MHVSTGLVAAIALSTATCNALTLDLWEGNCNGAKVQCGNAPYAECCTGGRPFCTSGNCDGCVDGNDIYTFNKAGCTGASFHSCRLPDNGCCNPAGSGNTCAIVAYVGGALKRDADPEECEVTIRPNKMEYTDNNGTAHSIHLPTGTFETAAQQFSDGDWAALNNYPAWADQTYTEADRMRKIKRKL